MFWEIVCAKIIFNGQLGCSHPVSNYTAHMGGCIDVAIDATKCRYRKVQKNHVQFLTAGKHYQSSIKRLLATRGGWPRLQAWLPAQRCSLLFQLWYSEDAEQVFQNWDSADSQEIYLWTGHAVASSQNGCKRENWVWCNMEDEPHCRKNCLEIPEVIIITIMRHLLKGCHQV